MIRAFSSPAPDQRPTGLGGGERLLELRKRWPQNVVVTEDYAPNVRLAEERPGPLGVKVSQVSLTRGGLTPAYYLPRLERAGLDIVNAE